MTSPRSLSIIMGGLEDGKPFLGINISPLSDAFVLTLQGSHKIVDELI
ncbi:hypothetical protein KEJ13_09110 [Candidatus Bathyarchaeota archaeon]|nr:hypothetical protein [Candidatus Bathyarchaeota archaeon]